MGIVSTNQIVVCYLMSNKTCNKKIILKNDFLVYTMKYQAITTVIDVKTTYDPYQTFPDIHDVLSVTAHYKIYILVILLSILGAFVFEINVMLIINTIPKRLA